MNPPRRDPGVLLFIGQLEGGGAEKHCFDLSAALSALGVPVRVCGTQAAPETLARYAGAGVPLSLVGPPAGPRAPGGFSPARARRFAARWNAMRRLLRDEAPFLVQSFLPYSNVIVPSLFPFAAVPVHVAGHRFAAWAGVVYNMSQVLEMAACRFSDLNLANSKDVARFLVDELHLPAGRVRIAVNGVSLDAARACAERRASARRELGLNEDDVAVGMASNLWRYKGVGVLQKAAALARERGVRLRVFVAGRDVGTLAQFEADSQQLGIEDSFRFLGGRGDVCFLLRAFDIYVSASEGEGMSNSILEAMAHGLPVIGSRAAGTPELLGDGSAGRLFDVGDAGALADALCELAAAPGLRARLGAAALERARSEFSPERMVSETLRAYAEASADHPAEKDYFLKKADAAREGWRAR